MASIASRRRSVSAFLLAAALCSAALPCGAQDGGADDPSAYRAAAQAAPPKAFDPSALIGMDLAAAYAALGAPAEVFSFEQAVVFFYPDYTYLFWFQNRIWQVRVDRRYAGAAMGFQMGEGKAEATSRIGRLFREQGDAVSYHIETAGFPLEARLVFEDGKLTDLYVYRSDW